MAAPSPRRSVACDAASLQFIKGIAEACVPEVSLKRARNGGSGTAQFTFDNPSIFQVGRKDVVAPGGWALMSTCVESREREGRRLAFRLKRSCRRLGVP